MARTPIHPGEILAEALETLAVTPTALARALDVPPNRITGILAGKRAVTADTALRLAHRFGTSATFWLNLQTSHDLRVAERDKGAAIRKLPKRAA